MGSFIEINDTLQLTREQGFPAELDLTVHLKKPYTAASFKGRVFEFKGKKGIRIYKMPPVRNFLVENRDGKWVYWGLAHIVEITHDCVNAVTSGKFRIIYINTPDEMAKAHELIDRNPKTSYFNRE